MDPPPAPSESSTPQDPSSPSSSTSPPPPPPLPRPSQPQPDATPLFPLSIIRARAPPKTDERCFTYCSQTSSRRMNGEDSFCRSFCLRRVFPHEIARLERDTREYGETHPLPAPGQPREALVSDGQVVGDGRDVRYWKAGWYVWYHTSRWTALDHLDGMMLGIMRQTWKMRQREGWYRMWVEHQRAVREGREPPDERDRYLLMEGEWVDPRGRIYPDLSKDAHLIPLPPPLPPLTLYIANLLSPASRLYSLTAESVTNGSQLAFAGRLWEKARSVEPWRLARNAVRKVLDEVWEGGEGGGNGDGEDSS
ncbi:hypothetical protein BD410DRAFT_833009 [Rickenella mellea]|uniref:Uncharacterized protein n=1 Tax=Rickenella mellea TaxID=50990 RepID=A0A4Y7PID3_9AGAM|nr:hypothetical protein BD410DRAFT_833009 [Rickenella mellea]